MNDRPPFEPYEGVCVREGGRWFADSGSGGFSMDVLAEAARLGWR